MNEDTCAFEKKLWHATVYTLNNFIAKPCSSNREKKSYFCQKD
jgi:hypothetical protein